MRSFLAKIKEKLKLCCCFGVCDENARLVDETKPLMVKIKAYEPILDQCRQIERGATTVPAFARDSLMFKSPPIKIERLQTVKLDN